MILDAEYILKITDSISSGLKGMEGMASDDSSSTYPVELYEVSSCLLLIPSVSILVPENTSKAEHLSTYLFRKKVFTILERIKRKEKREKNVDGFYRGIPL